MATADSEVRLRSLLANLDSVITLLRAHGELHWSTWLAECRSELVLRDPAAIKHILRAFGGMGSFNDLWVLAANGHVVEAADEQAVSEQLDDLRTAIWTGSTIRQ